MFKGINEIEILFDYSSRMIYGFVENTEPRMTLLMTW